MAVRYVETRALHFKEKRSSRNDCDERDKNIYAQRKHPKEKQAVHEFSSHAPTPPPRVPIGRPNETRRSIMPIPAEVVSTARDATGLLPPWQLSCQSSPQAERAKRAPARLATANGPPCIALAARPRQLRNDRSDSEPEPRGAVTYLI